MVIIDIYALRRFEARLTIAWYFKKSIAVHSYSYVKCIYLPINIYTPIL